MKAHIIESNLVVNTIEVLSLDFMDNLVDAELGGKIGDNWDGTTFSSPTVSLDDVAADARQERNNLLAATDWTANSDVTMTTEMTAYRTLLRNLPAQADFPTTINWPTAP